MKSKKPSDNLFSNQLFDHFWKNQPQIFHFWPTLNEDEKKKLTDQLSRISIATLNMQRRLVEEKSEKCSKNFDSFNDFAIKGNSQNQIKGEQLIKEGRLGCLLLAGGQGTRLQHNGPKGTYPISVIKNKSLFQLCAEKVKAAGVQAGRQLKLAIMTSPENNIETEMFFDQHHFFGLDRSQVSFFIQETLPLLDSQGNLFLRSPYEIAEGANGNGCAFSAFAQSGILSQWIDEGIEYLHMILIDNPLADPFDAELLGFHVAQHNEITCKCTEKTDPKEKVGLLVKKKRGEEHCAIIEYSEMEEEEKEARRADGRLKHCCANLSLFCFSLSFIQRVTAIQHLSYSSSSSTHISLPLHKAWKAVPFIDDHGIIHQSTACNAWKFETFIFDWLIYAHKVGALIYPREECFAPLKNKTGADSPKSVREALQQSDRRVIQAITGLKAPEFPFELDAQFYYPTVELLQQWKGKTISEKHV